MHIFQDLGFSQVDFEGDCKEVVLAVTSSGENNSKLYPLIHDIHSLLRNQPNWTVQFTPRETNQAAHNLASLACSV